MADEIVRGKPGEPEPQNPSLAYEDSSITAYVVATSWTVFPSASDLGWTKDGYFFTGWNTAADGTGTAYAVGDACAHPFVVFAQWAVNSDYLTTTEELTFIADAIRTKGGTSAALEFPTGFVTAIGNISGGGITPTGTINITTNGTHDVTNYASANVSVSGGGGGSPDDDVVFYDYDGSVVDSYSAADFANLASLPANPSHTGLTAQGWNWTLSDAKTYVASYGKLDIGQMYVTDDGKTRIHIKLGEGRLAPYLGIAVNGTVDIDWGDGTAHGSLTGTSLTTVKRLQHTYAAAGEYTIVLNGGSFSFIGASPRSYLLTQATTNVENNDVYLASIEWVEVGSNAAIGTYGLAYCFNLRYITIPSSVSVSDGAFYYCYNMEHLTLPTSATALPRVLAYYCWSLTSVSIPKQTTGLSNNQVFTNCSSLRRIIIPPDATNIPDSMAYYCYSLREVIMPNSVTSIGSSAFRACHSLRSVSLPSSLTTIKSSGFSACYGLESIVIPSGVTSIASNGFAQNYGLGKLKFEGTTPPTLGASSSFGNLPTDCKIYVPSAALSAYTSASNYPSSGTYTYVGY